MDRKAESFWMVWNPAGRPPAVRHDIRGAAMNEAKRLASQVPGQSFFVLQAVAEVKTHDPIQVIEMDEIPF